MTTTVKTLVAWALAALLGGLVFVHSASAAVPSTGTPIDPARPETWDAALRQVKEEQDSAVEALIKAGADESRDPEERRTAILALSSVRTQRSLEFLIRNVSLEIEGRIITGDSDSLKQTPCAYVLAEQRLAGDTPAGLAFQRPGQGGATLSLPHDLGREWATARAIIYGLDREERPRRDLLLLAYALYRDLGKDVALAALDDALKNRVPATGPWRNNLTAIRKYVQQK